MVLHVKFEFHSNRDTLTYFTAQSRSKPFICIHGLKNHMGQFMKLWLSCYLVLLSIDSKPGNKTAAVSWPDPYRGLRLGTHTYIVSVLIPTDFRHGWEIFGPLADKNTWKGGVTRAPSQRKVFRTFFVHVVRYQFETWHIHLVGGITRQVWVSFQSGHFDLLYSQK